MKAHRKGVGLNHVSLSPLSLLALTSRPCCRTASHKKFHSTLANSSEGLAILFKSVLEERGFVGCLDLDDVSEISMSAFEQHIAESVCLVILMNDETAQSYWCREEWKIAQRFQVPVVCVFNQDEFNLRQIRAIITSTRGEPPLLPLLSNLPSPRARITKAAKPPNQTSSWFCNSCLHTTTVTTTTNIPSSSTAEGYEYILEQQTVHYTSSSRRAVFADLCARINRMTTDHRMKVTPQLQLVPDA